jgi:hypothetical protein
MVSFLQWWFRFFTQIAVWPRDLPVLLGAFRRRVHWRPPAEVWAIVDSVPGFMSDQECGLLYRAARFWPVAGPVVELGSFKGRSATLLALAGRQVHAVDAWVPAVYQPTALGPFFMPSDEILAECQANLQRTGVAGQVTIHRGLTAEVGRGWQVQCALLFIDAGHDYANVRGDLDAWLPHLLPGGLLLLHDTFSDRYDGVVKAAGELLKAGWEIVASTSTLVALAQKATARQVTPAHFGA